MIAINNVRKLTLNFLKMRRERWQALDNMREKILKPRLNNGKLKIDNGQFIINSFVTEITENYH